MRITDEVTNEEVKGLKGLHLYYFWCIPASYFISSMRVCWELNYETNLCDRFSSCSQKVRILLAEKELEFERHHVDLITCENATEEFLSINKRGLVPILVHDGEVHVESNDILQYIDETFEAGDSQSFFVGDRW